MQHLIFNLHYWKFIRLLLLGIGALIDPIIFVIRLVVLACIRHRAQAVERDDGLDGPAPLSVSVELLESVQIAREVALREVVFGPADLRDRMTYTSEWPSNQSQGSQTEYYAQE